jgi:hypothetical protein
MVPAATAPYFGNQVDFNFAEGIGTSLTQMIKVPYWHFADPTNPQYRMGTIDLVDGVRTVPGTGLPWVGAMLADAYVPQFASAIPEPETYALMLTGLGMIGAVVRRRKDSQV